jgi:hypothetical protein
MTMGAGCGRTRLNPDAADPAEDPDVPRTSLFAEALTAAGAETWSHANAAVHVTVASRPHANQTRLCFPIFIPAIDGDY